MVNKLFGIIIGYIIGSISFSLIFAKMWKVNLRDVGSKNLGATNLSRQLGWKIAIMPAVLDAIKTPIAMLIAIYILKSDSQGILLVGFFAIIGHMFPAWNNFKGGKGVASFIGFAYSTQNFFIPFTLCMIMIIINKKFKIMTYASLPIVTAIPIFSFFSKKSIFYDFSNSNTWIYSATIFVIIIYMHKENIINLIKGKEKKSGQHKK